MYIYGKIKATLDKGIQTIVISEIKTDGPAKQAA